jgi:hypothetical protein
MIIVATFIAGTVRSVVGEEQLVEVGVPGDHVHRVVVVDHPQQLREPSRDLKRDPIALGRDPLHSGERLEHGRWDRMANRSSIVCGARWPEHRASKGRCEAGSTTP